MQITMTLLVAVILAGARPAFTQLGPVIVTHDNVRSAGRLHDGVLSLGLWAGVGRWYPEGASSRSRQVAAFGEEGAPLSIPSPLVRVARGTSVHVTLRNTLNAPLRVHGLCDRPGPCQPITVPAGGARETRFALNDAGTFHYWAETGSSGLEDRTGDDSQLGGVIVVDPQGAVTPDRVFLLGLMKEHSDSGAVEFAVVNGRSWPYTERLEYRSGESVRWRVANLTFVAHPLHLHGFYFNVVSAGDGVQDGPVDRSPVVTERVAPGGTVTLTWVPERPGNWLFHCHMLAHHVARHPPAHYIAGQPTTDSTSLGMQGLVLGIRVTGPPGAALGTGGEVAPRRLQLVVAPDTRAGATPSYRVDVRDGAGPAPRVSTGAVPGPVMVLTRGVPVAVEVVNRLTEPTAIHWHGIELESRYDGVPDLSGSPGSVTPAIRPGESFTALFTPPRAGTFMYHSHWHNRAQLSAGVYGPIVVLEPGQRYDPTRDHIFVIGLDGPYREFPNEPLVVNGTTKPDPLELEAGVPHRLRLIGIAADNPSLVVQLLDGSDPIQWMLVSKDAAEIPPAARTLRPARQSLAVGETYDFELAPAPQRTEGLWMEIRRGGGPLLFRWPVRFK